MPWPGWPVSRLILGPWLAASCSSRYTDRVTMDTILSWPALDAGALAAVVAQDRVSEFAGPVRSKLFAVTDTLAALQELAQAVRTRWGRRLAAVTGSAGKTTTKEILAALLAARFRVLKSEGNLNNEYGLPLQLLRLEDSDEAAVVELGMSHAGELKRLAEIARPDVGVVTRVAPVHLEFFASVDEIALAKRELIEGLAGPESVAVLNADDPRVARFAQVAPGRVVTFGLAGGADFRAENINDCGMDGSEFDFLGPAGLPDPARPAGGRTASGSHCRSPGATMFQTHWLHSLRRASGAWARPRRGSVSEFAGHWHARPCVALRRRFSVINDCYNSNPVALAAMIDLLAHTPAPGRRILAAGEMLELGPSSPELHREAGRAAASAGKLDWIIGVQGDAESFVRGGSEAGHPPAHTQFFPSSAEAAEFLVNLVQPGDLLLVKGSRGVKMERIVEALDKRLPRSNPGQAVTASRTGSTATAKAKERG